MTRKPHSTRNLGTRPPGCATTEALAVRPSAVWNVDSIVREAVLGRLLSLPFVIFQRSQAINSAEAILPAVLGRRAERLFRVPLFFCRKKRRSSPGSFVES